MVTGIWAIRSISVSIFHVPMNDEDDPSHVHYLGSDSLCEPLVSQLVSRANISLLCQYNLQY